MRGALTYIRTSTTEQTPELQLADISTLHPPVDALIIQEQQSAFKDNVKRPEMERLYTEIKSGKVSDIFVWDLDRLFRNRLRLKEFFILCRTFKVSVHSFNQSWLDDLNKVPPPFDEIVIELLINITGWLGQEESSKKSNRVKMAVRKRNGLTLSYKGNRWGRKPFPKQTIDRVMELHKRGMSVREISKNVNVYDKNNNSRPISKSAVHKITTEFTPENDS